MRIRLRHRVSEDSSKRRRAVSRLAMALLVIIGCSGSSHTAIANEVPIDEAGFTAYLSRAFAQSLPGFKVTIADSLALSIKRPSGESSTSYLHTIYSFCLRNSDRCDEAVARHVAEMSATYKQTSTPPERPRLRAVVRPARYVDQLREALAGKGEPVATPLSAGLWVVCVADLPQAIQYLRPADLTKIELSRDEAIELGKQNVAAALRPLTSVVHDLPEHGIGTIAGDPYESSRFLLPESWKFLADRLGGKLIVSIPATDVMLYARESDPHAVEALATLTRDVATKANRPLSLVVFRWTPWGWEQASP